MSVPSQQIVDEDALRRLFNQARFWQRTLTNEFTLYRFENKEVTLPPEDQRDWQTHAEGTRRQMWEYRDRKTDTKVAVVCMFVRPDGLLGGAIGKPDPKMVFLDGTHYYLKKRPTRPV